MAVTPDDFPIVGPTRRFANLYVNTGHGFRGTNWSLASGALLAQSMGLGRGMGDATAQELRRQLVESVSPSRFGE